MKVEGIDAVEIVTGGDRNKKESESDVGTMPPTSPPLSPSAQTQARITSPRPDSKYSESTLVAKMRTKKGLRYGRKPEAALLSDARWSQSQQSECRQRRQKSLMRAAATSLLLLTPLLAGPHLHAHSACPPQPGLGVARLPGGGPTAIW